MYVSLANKSDSKIKMWYKISKDWNSCHKKEEQRWHVETLDILKLRFSEIEVIKKSITMGEEFMEK